MFSYIREKCAPLHPSVFSAEILNNWECWYETQKLMFSDTDSFIINIDLFEWPKPFRFRADDMSSLKSLLQNFQTNQLEHK